MTTAGYGWFRTTLFSFVNPLAEWSRLLSGPTRDGDYEGFAYLGAGVLGLLVAIAGICIVKRERIEVKMNIVVPLALLTAGLYVYALSSHVTAGSRDLFTYDPPSILAPLTSTFRASGRFVWPVIYLIEFSAFAVLFRKLSVRPAKFLLATLLLIQVVDLSQASAMFKARWSETWTSPLKSAFWDQVPRQYRKIAFAIPTSDMGGYGPIALLAARNEMSINGGEIARMNATKLVIAQNVISGNITAGNYRQDALYVFTKDYLWQQALLNARPADFAGWVNGYRVLAPDWKGCTTACGLSRATATPFPSGAEINFSVGGTSDQYLGNGWAGAEGQGRWTNQNQASMTMWLGHPASQVKIRVKLWALVNANHPMQRLDATANGTSIAHWTFSDSLETTREIDLDPGIIASNKGFLTITFSLPDAISPKAIGMADDTRNLAVFVEKMSVSY